VARTHRRMGDILQKLEKFEEASINYQKAIKMFENFLKPTQTTSA
jgi:predicted RNA polymerase sigma factor